MQKISEHKKESIKSLYFYIKNKMSKQDIVELVVDLYDVSPTFTYTFLSMLDREAEQSIWSCKPEKKVKLAVQRIPNKSLLWRIFGS